MRPGAWWSPPGELPGGEQREMVAIGGLALCPTLRPGLLGWPVSGSAPVHYNCSHCSYVKIPSQGAVRTRLRPIIHGASDSPFLK